MVEDAEEFGRLSIEACLDINTKADSRRASCATVVARRARDQSPLEPLAPVKFPSLNERDEIFFLTPMSASHCKVTGMG